MLMLSTMRSDNIRRSRGAPRQRWCWGDVRGWCWRVAVAAERRLRLLKLSATVAAFLAVSAAALLLLPMATALYAGMLLWRCGVLWYACRSLEGVVGLATSSSTSVLEGSTPAVATTILTLQGAPDIQVIRERIKKELVDAYSGSGGRRRRKHTNLRRRLVRVCGLYCWLEHPQFDISNHVVMAPAHFHHTTVSARNIQEFVSTICQTPIREDVPPWQATVIGGVGDDLEQTTWVVLRAHHLLATQLSLPNILISTYLDPWATTEATILPLLTAPVASNLLASSLIKKIFPFLLGVFTTLRAITVIIVDNVFDFIKMTAPSFHRKVMEEFHYVSVETFFYFRCMRLLDLCIRMPNMFYNGIYELVTFWKHDKGKHFLQRCVVAIACRASWGMLVLIVISCCLVVRVAIDFIYLILWLKRIRKYRTPEEKMVINAVLEIYWIIRAMISIPRLLFEEILETKRALPLQVWKGQRRPGGQQIVWNEGVPLNLVYGIQQATGASLSSILLTATAGAVRDLLKCSGIPVPSITRCTLPVYTPRGSQSPSPTLLSLSLPTGATDSKTALSQMRKTLRHIRGYPEKYLASAWFLKNISLLLPRDTLLWAARQLKITERYPVLLTHVMAPETQLTLWGMKLTGILHLRQPLQEAVVSVCVSQYCGRVQVAAVAADWAAPYAIMLPRGFASALSDLAVTSGVRLTHCGQPLRVASPSCNGILRRSFSFSTRADRKPQPPTLNTMHLNAADSNTMAPHSVASMVTDANTTVSNKIASSTITISNKTMPLHAMTSSEPTISMIPYAYKSGQNGMNEDNYNEACYEVLSHSTHYYDNDTEQRHTVVPTGNVSYASSSRSYNSDASCMFTGRTHLLQHTYSDQFIFNPSYNNYFDNETYKNERNRFPLPSDRSLYPIGIGRIIIPENGDSSDFGCCSRGDFGGNQKQTPKSYSAPTVPTDNHFVFKNGYDSHCQKSNCCLDHFHTNQNDRTPFQEKFKKRRPMCNNMMEQLGLASRPSAVTKDGIIGMKNKNKEKNYLTCENINKINTGKNNNNKNSIRVASKLSANSDYINKFENSRFDNNNSRKKYSVLDLLKLNKKITYKNSTMAAI